LSINFKVLPGEEISPLEFREKVNLEVTGFLQEVGYGGGIAVPKAEGVGSGTST